MGISANGDNNYFNIGICWQAKQGLFQELSPYCNRTIPLSAFQQLSTIANVQLHSLQKGPGTEQLKQINFPINHLPEEFDNYNGAFVDTAAFINNLDLIITADTSIAHLAGAMSKPVWVILPYVSDIRWMTNGNNTPWYPTMRLFRQKSPGNWQSAIDEVVVCLKEKFPNQRNH